MRTIVCGVDGSPGARAALRIAASLAEAIGARLVAVHVLDRLLDAPDGAERIANSVLYDEVPDASAEARGEVGAVAERLAAVARDEDATLIVLGARSRGRSRAHLRVRCAAELAELTTVPVVVAPPQRAALAPRRRVKARAKGSREGPAVASGAGKGATWVPGPMPPELRRGHPRGGQHTKPNGACSAQTRREPS